MDPPSSTEEIPEPKPKLEPEPEPEPENVKPVPQPPPPEEEPPVPPKSPNSSIDGPILDTIDAAVAASEKAENAVKDTPSSPPPQATATAANAAATDNAVEESASAATPPPSTPAPTPAPTPSTTTTDSNENPLPLSPAQRTTSFDELRSYEAKRRSIYLKKLKSSSIYWKAFRDTLSKSYQETERAEIIMQGALVANQHYAEFLAGAAEDKLDYGGKPLDEKRARKYQGDKARKYSALGSGSLLWNMEVSKKENEEKKRKEAQQKLAELNNKDVSIAAPKLVESVSFDGLPDDSMLTGFIESHGKMAEKFHENYTFIKEVALQKTTQLRKELEKEVHVMSMLGDATIFELEKAEDDVQKAWAAYYALASQNVGPSIQVKLHRGKSDKHTITDVWLVEMHYRMSVAYLTTIWEKCSAELSNLFASMKELECNRRFRLSELMILYQQRAERLWLSIPTIVTSVTKELVSIPTDTDTIEKDVQNIIREKATFYQKKDSAQMKSDPMNAPGLAGVPDLKKGYELQSPLISDLIGKAQVVWRKNDKLMSVWKPSLAIATSDCYLHLFDIPHYSNVQTGTAPELAFQALVPPVKIPNEDDLVSGNYPWGVNWYDNLVPTDTIDLSESKITFSETKGNSTFELTETLPPNKLSAVSNFVRKKKLSLRMYSSQHMVEWLLTLKNYGAE